MQHQGLELVLRHYQRGGLVRHFNKDLYPFTGLQRTRMWREFKLLLRLRELELPVPVPVAAQCHRLVAGLCRGDLITLRIANAKTLAQVLCCRALEEPSWRDLGALLARFHSCGVFHADLNANNILVDADGNFHLLDFDKGELRDGSPGWQKGNLARLLRSLLKFQGRHEPFNFRDADWSNLELGYREHQS